MAQNPARKPRTNRDEVGNDVYRGFVSRILKAYGRRIGAGDIAALPELVALRSELDEQIAASIAHLRSEEGGSQSWQRIADELKITRQAAMQRWGSHPAVKAVEGRKRGAQPAGLR